VERHGPVGTIGRAISLRVRSPKAQAIEVVKQIGTPYLPDPIMRRPRADREEKRVIHGNEAYPIATNRSGVGNRLTMGTPIREDS
jgi:hypothetical protein